MAYENCCGSATISTADIRKVIGPSPAKVSMMDDVEMRLVATIDRLCNEVELLEGRLYRVLDMNTAECSSDKYTEPSTSRLDNAIYKQTTRLNNLADHISSIREGLIL